MTEPGTEHEEGRGPQIAAAGAAVLVVLLAAVLLLGGDDYRVTARFEAATALVKGNLVEAGGRKVGTVEEIRLGRDGVAEVELAITEDELDPLPEGTQANIRLRSLSGQANRFVDLRLPEGRADEQRDSIPDGGVLPTSATASAVDVDTFFSLFDEDTRKGLRKVIRGNAELYGGRSQAANDGFEALSPSLVATRRLFGELNRDSALLERFVVASSGLVTDLAERDESLAQLVDRLATATGAIAREEQSLTRAVGTLPPFMRRANTTFANLRSTLDDVAPLVEESKPVAPLLRKVLAELRPFARDAKPTVRDLARLAGRPGADNDLLDLARRVPALRDIAVSRKVRNGEERDGALPTGTRSLRGQTPQLAYLRPYSVDLTGWFDDFGHSGAYDANGNFNRSAITANAFAIVDGQLRPVPPELREDLLGRVTALGQNNRCPGSIERGATWKPTPDFACDETQGPVGP